MKTKKIELDVDFIGGQGSLTLAEEIALSDFFKKRRLTAIKSLINHQERSIKRSTKVKAISLRKKKVS